MVAMKRLGLLAVLLAMGVLAIPAMGQPAPGGNGGGGGAGGGPGGPGGGGFGGGGFNPQAMRQRIMDQIKEALHASDDEFTAMQPKIEKVMQLRRDVMAGAMRFGRGGRGGGGGGFGGGPGGGGGGGFGGPGGGGQDTNPSPVQMAVQDLSSTLDKPDATPDEIKSKLDALRQARKDAQQALGAAQADLKSLLTQRQEAVMVLYGMVE